MNAPNGEARPANSFLTCSAVQAVVMGCVFGSGYWLGVFGIPPEHGWPSLLVVCAVVVLVSAHSQWRAGQR